MRCCLLFLLCAVLSLTGCGRAEQPPPAGDKKEILPPEVVGDPPAAPAKKRSR
jgi:hypothetical protein